MIFLLKIGLFTFQKMFLFIYFNKSTFLLKYFSFMLKAIFVLKISKRLHEKANVSFKTYDVTDSTPSNYNSHFARYLKK